jgi:hypothetical protein
MITAARRGGVTCGRAFRYEQRRQNQPGPALSVCPCRGRRRTRQPAAAGDHLPTAWLRRYPSDTGDTEWVVLASHVPAGAGRGRPIVYPRRDVVNAIRYLDRGLPLARAAGRLPHHGMLNRMHNSLREQVRTQVEGRNRQPTAVVVVAQTVRGAETVAGPSRG